MQTATIQDLIEAGVHFGCRVSRWNPKMASYIHGRRSLIHIIDLRETIRGLVRAQNFLYHLAAEGSQILWVGTKRQVKGVINEAGERTGMPTVIERWIGGTLTNFSVIRSRLRRLEELETQEEDGTFDQFSKKAVSSLRREKRKITRNLGGIREMTGIPGAMVVVDPAREANAVREARKMGVAVIGLLDTDCDPESVDIVIPGNDDALKSVRLLIDQLSSAVEEGAANARERAATMGAAERSDELPVGDEPRPTRGQTLPPAMRRTVAPAKSAEETEKAEAETAAPAPAPAAESAPEPAAAPAAKPAAESATEGDSAEVATGKDASAG
jgi:small subunit ribosomal protein S2